MLKSKFIVPLLVAAISFTAFTGCQNKSNSVPSSGNQKTAFSKQHTNMKSRITDGLKALVSDGTITKAESDKISQVLNSNSNGFGKRQKPKDGDNNSNKESNSNKGSKTFSNPLSKLVEDGTITQEQADKVMEKVRGNFGNRRRGSNSDKNSDNKANSSNSNNSTSST